MACSVAKKDRSEYVQNLVLDFFVAMEGPDVDLTLDTSLGKFGLGHTMVKRKTYFDPLEERLAVKGCTMRTLKPSSFADDKLKFIGDVANLIEKNLV
jgi:hypothetical protein